MFWCVLALAVCMSCSGDGPEPPSREDVLPLLQQEAQAMKSEGENVNPKLEVQMTWNINSVDIRPRPNDENQPWAGTIDFTITSRIKELDGYITEETHKKFEYVWDVGLQKWIIH